MVVVVVEDFLREFVDWDVDEENLHEALRLEVDRIRAC